ncbi:hypothetical protein ACFY0N_07905 [Streptomyces vinaceus]|uniref:hypothetical protein n=1 Tax=Streptomyces vinaceus TaxID=1960 RepID=UPI0036AD5A42
MSVGDQKEHTRRARGPMQLTFSRSIDPVTPLEAGITRLTPNKRVRGGLGCLDGRGPERASGGMGGRQPLVFRSGW